MKPKFLLLFLFLNSYHLLAFEKNKLQVRTIAISPYGIESSNKLSGIYYDLTNLLLKKLNYECTHLIYPYVRIIHELKTGKTDLSIMFKYKELEPFVQYLYPLPTLKNVVLGRKGLNLVSIDSLTGKTIAYLRGAKFSDKIDDNKSIKKYMVDNFNQGLLMLNKGRVDAIIGPLQPIRHAANKLHLPEDFFGLPLIVSERTPWLQLSNKSLNKISVEQLKTVFSAIMNQGDYEKIKSKYQ